jgi:hypothetical protein
VGSLSVFGGTDVRDAKLHANFIILRSGTKLDTGHAAAKKYDVFAVQLSRRVVQILLLGVEASDKASGRKNLPGGTDIRSYSCLW